MQRLRGPSLDTLSRTQREVYKRIANGRRGNVPQPLQLWLHSPAMAASAEALGIHCRYESRLPPRLSELAILTVGAFWQAGYEWTAHEPAALAAGISPEALDAIRTGGAPVFLNDDEAVIHCFCDDLLRRKSVSDDVFARAIGYLGVEGVVDLVAIVGYYGFISLTIRAFQIDIPNGAHEPFEPLQ